MDIEDDMPDFLSGDHHVTPDQPPQDDPAPAAPEDPSQEPAAEPVPAPATDPAAAPTPPPQDAPAPAEPSPAAARDVPLPTFLDMRDRAVRAERALAERPAAEAPPIPDRAEDPDGYEQHREAQMQLVLFEQRRDITRSVAEVKHGAELVNTAFDWAAEMCDRSPAFNRAVMTAGDPAALVVAEYQRVQRDKALAGVSMDEITAFRQWQASQSAAAPAASASSPPTPPAAAPAAPPTFRRSLASAPSAGASAAPEGQDGAQVFEGMFGTG